MHGEDQIGAYSGKTRYTDVSLSRAILFLNGRTIDIKGRFVAQKNKKIKCLHAESIFLLQEWRREISALYLIKLVEIRYLLFMITDIVIQSISMQF